MKSVVICGLYRQDLQGFDDCSLKRLGEVWTLNDWYRPYPWMRPDRLFNLHLDSHVCAEDHRFPGDWQAEYNRAINHGTRVVVNKTIKGVNPAGQEKIDPLVWRRVPAHWRQIAVMTYLAALEGFDRITHKGVRLRDTEYLPHIVGLLEAMEIARNRGVEIVSPHEARWRDRADKVDWSNIDDYKEYWGKSCDGSLDKSIEYVRERITKR
jgi:hypothetical protein